MPRWICPECVQGKHPNCNGQAWDTDNDAPTACQCGHSIKDVMSQMDDEERGFLLIKENYAFRDPFLTAIEHGEQEKIAALLEGHKIEKVADDHLMLDDGTLLKVVPNQGGCSCGAGDYDLTYLNGADNVITKVEFDYRPTGDDDGYGWDNKPEDVGYYRIFVLAEDKKINLLQVDGDDGNGYYGTGFSLLVRKPVVKGKVEQRSLETEPTVADIRKAEQRG